MEYLYILGFFAIMTVIVIVVGAVGNRLTNRIEKSLFSKKNTNNNYRYSGEK